MPTRDNSRFTVLMLSGASSVHTIRWANAMAAKGVAVHLVTQHDPVDPLLPEVTVHRFPHVKGLGYIVNGPRLKRLMVELQPDVVNAHYASGYGTLARWVGRTPLVLNVWGSDVYQFPEEGPVQLRLLRDNLKRADRVVSTSKAMAARVREVCPAIAEIDVVPFGVDISVFTPQSERSKEANTLVVGTVKSLAETYGIDLLIEAFALLGKQMEPLPVLRLVGSGPQESELRALVRKKGLMDRVTFVPRVAHDKVPAELAKLDVYVALSRQESFGVAVIEASACELPVVVSNVGGLPEVVIDASTGFLVPANDPASAALRITELLASEDLRHRMGKAGRAFIEKEYGWNASVDRMLCVLKAAARRKT